MSKIIVMDMSLANLIAAGEVVERPASVVKELVENALDAKANQITIEIEQAGLKKIVVTDNGTGMDQGDIKLAFLRHATSKVYKKQDLTQIQTLGFRGEALPSIASVSKIKLSSRMKDQDGYFVLYADNKLENEGLISMNVGTKVEVEDLFFNTPARFKYLRSEYAERHAITDLVDKLCLSHPFVAFKLIVDGKQIRQTLGQGSIHALVEEIYGKQATSGMKHLKTSIAKIDVDAYLVNPSFVRSKRSDVNIFINHRFIKNYAISQSVIDGYSSYLMTQKYPIALVYISIDPSLIDVNVHPQKMEVKLANEMMFAYALTPEIKATLDEGKFPIKETLKEIYKEVSEPVIQSLFEIEPEMNESVDILQEVATPTLKLPMMEYIGTLNGTYLLFQNHEGLFLMDQHAAAERIRYEYYAQKVGELNSNRFELLIPKALLISKLDGELLNQFHIALKDIGFVIENGFLHAHPVWLREDEIDVAIESIVNQLHDYQTIDLKRLRNQLAKDISCKGAIKANHQLSRKEIDALVDDLKACANPYTCPHGRPVMIKLTTYEIEKMFKRIV